MPTATVVSENRRAGSTGTDSQEFDAITRRLEALLPDIRARRQEIERARRIPADLAQAIQRTGVYALVVPRVLGGIEGTPHELMRIVESVSAADGSTGWCVMIGFGGSIAAGYMPEEGAREVFADPEAPSAGIAAPAGAAMRVDGGVRVSGRWSFASGIAHSPWVWAGCVVMEGGAPRMTPHGPEILHVYLPVSDVTVHDVWQVSGLCGTGSNDFTAADLFVPAKRTFALLDPGGHRAEPLYRMPPLPQFVFLVASVSLGLGRAALDELVELAQAKVPTLYTGPLADRPAAQLALARAEAALGGARSFLYEAVGDIWDTVRAGGEPSPRQIALGRAAATQAAETAAEVTRTASLLAGGTAIAASSALQRHARDADAVLHHFTMAAHTWEEAGRVLLGRTPVAFAF